MTVTIKGGEKLKAFLDKIIKQKAKLDVGFFPEAKYEDGTPVASVAIWNEFGTETDDGKKLIPPRPFLFPTYNKQKEKWKQYLFDKIESQGEDIDLKKALKATGFVAQKDVQEAIDEWARAGNPRNADSTIEKKGFDSPLYEHGHLRESVDYKVSTK